MDPLRLCIALTPLALYLLLMAYVNFGTRPKVWSRVRDLSALGFGIMGLMIVGPMSLFLPESAASRLGWMSWVLMLALYVLSLALVVLSARPRLVIYNVTPEELRPALASVVQELDSQARWAGDSVTMPAFGINLHLDNSHSMRNVQLVSSGPEQHYPSWSKLERRLRATLRKGDFRTVGRFRNQNGFLFLLLAGMLVFMVGKKFIQEHDAMAHSLREMLRL